MCINILMLYKIFRFSEKDESININNVLSENDDCEEMFFEEVDISGQVTDSPDSRNDDDGESCTFYQDNGRVFF